MFYTRVAWVCLVCLLLCKEKVFSPVFAITEEVYGPVCGALACVFVGFWESDYVSQLTCVRYCFC